MNIDLITIWPRDHDYPPFRKNLQRLEPYYNRAIIVLNGQHGQPDYGTWLANNTNPKKTIIRTSRQHHGNEDWRNVAIQEGLEVSKAEWVWFIEQDFFFTDSFVQKLLAATNTYNVIGFWESNRLHPACLLIRRAIIDATKKDFSVIPGKLDHFGAFSEEVVAIEGEAVGTFEKVGIAPTEWYHMQGLTHNYNLCRRSDLSGIYLREEFLTYNYYAPFTDISVSEHFWEETRNAKRVLGDHTDHEELAGFLKQLL
jgi:hypothetical protein